MNVLKQAALFVRANLWIVPLVGLLVWVLFRFLDPAPPRTLVMTTGSETGSYHQFGLALKDELAKEGLTLEVRSSRGSLDNIQRLTDRSGEVQLGLIQSGIERLATARERDRLIGLAALYHEPLWLFQRNDVDIQRLSDLSEMRVSLGGEGSGTWSVVRSLFEAQGDLGSWESQGDGRWRTLAGRAAFEALVAEELDAAFFVLPADNSLVRELVRHPQLSLVNLRQTEAFSARLPFLADLSIPEGLLDISRNVPAQEINLLSPVATLVANEHFHPALTALVLEAAREVLREGNLLDPPDRFPAATPMALPLSGEADYYHRSGTPFLQRYLPFWIASIVDRYIVLVIPFIVIMMPLMRSMGPIYRWRMRARVYRWYEQLRRVDRLILKDQIQAVLEEEIKGLHRLEDELTRVDVPLSYAHELYSLHLHVRYMINRLKSMRAEAEGQDPGEVLPS